MDLVSKNNKLLSTAANIFLVFLIFISLAQAALFFIENLSQVEFIATPNQSRQATRQQQNFNIDKLNLFGTVTETEIVTKQIEAPITTLNLELQGVFTTEDPADASAIVASKGKPGELYHIDDRLPGNAILNAVFNNYVLIKRGSRIEKLAFYEGTSIEKFPDNTANTANTTTASFSNPANQQQSETRLQQIRERITQRTQDLSRNRGNRNRSSEFRQQLASYQQRLDQEPQAVLDEFGLVPVDNSSANGYKIGAEVSQSMLRQAGLQQGDVVLSVNGQPVGNIQNDRSLINKAIASKRVRVEVQRGARRFFVTVPVPN
ncbi:MAG: PDZ domain-containing protein [Pseudomonadales bacterium]|nr:PDZ domain-containing protein [Pseudomonadales bacterium]